MRVLMFGWEFPPHISGGLGTACFGLSQSLVRENVDLTFVVPRLHGSESAENMHLIDASSVRLPIAGEKETIVLNTTQRAIRTNQVSSKTATAAGDFAVVEVQASLDPYTMTTSESSSPASGLERWNYVFDDVSPVEHTITETTREVIPPRGYTYAFSGGYGKSLFEEVEQYALVGAELAGKFDHDVIHAHDWMTFGAGIAAKKVSGKPLVIHVHATEYDRSGQLGGPVFEWEKRGMLECDRIVAVSQWTKDILVSKYGISADKVEVVHNGITVSEEPFEATPPPVGSHVVTFLGRVTHQKGPRYFIEAARRVAESFPEAHFVVAGSGDQLPQIIERVAQLRLSDRFHFTGFLNKEWISRIWSMSSVYVMPSVSEPFGITPLEAIQAGVPVIVSNQSGVAEVMPDALKVDFWDTDALAESICSVLKYKSLSAMLRTRGEKQLGELTWNRAAVKLKSLYEELTPTLG